jgi:hypothetical protein
MISCIDVLAVNCIPVGDDMVGELSSGYAVLRGSIIAGYFDFRPHSYGQYYIASYEHHYITMEGAQTKFFPDYVFDADNESRVEDGDCIFCLRIATDHRREEDRFRHDDFLVLRRKRGMIATFERIGLIELDVNGVYGNGDDFYQMFESRREECAVTIV